MATRYPLIRDRLNTRNRSIDGGESETTSLSTSDYSTLSAIFPNSPVYSSAAPFTSDETYRAYAQTLLIPTTQTGDADQFPTGVNLDYAGSPNLNATPDGFESSYYPNRIVNSDPAGGEGTAITTEGDLLTPNDNFGNGGFASDSANQPSTTAAAIAGTTLGTALPLGQSLAHAPGSGAASSTAFSTSTTSA